MGSNVNRWVLTAAVSLASSAALAQHAPADAVGTVRATAQCPLGCAPTHRATARARIRARRANPRAVAATVDAERRWRDEHAARVAAEEALERQLQELRTLHDEQDARISARVAALQREQERLAATSLPDRYTRRSYTLARGGGPPMVDSGGFYQRPRIELGLEGGIGGLTDANSSLAGTWGVRAGIAAANWLEFEGRYFGLASAVGGTRPNGGVMYNGASTVVRLMAPLTYVRPYAFGGIGVYQQSRTGNVAPDQNIGVNGRLLGVVPIGGGIDVPIMPHFSFGAEATYHVFLPATSSTGTSSSMNLWTATALFRYSI